MEHYFPVDMNGPPHVGDAEVRFTLTEGRSLYSKYLSTNYEALKGLLQATGAKPDRSRPPRHRRYHRQVEVGPRRAH